MALPSALTSRLVIAATVSLWLAACSNDTQRNAAADSTKPVTVAAAKGMAPPDKDAILTSARNDYDYETPERSPDDADNPNDITNGGVPAGQAPTMKISKATRKSPVSSPTEEVLARIVSDKPYAPLGIIAGTNYLWRDRNDPDHGKWKVYMIADDATTKPNKLKRSNAEYVKSDDSGPHPHTQPRIARATKRKNARVDSFAFGVCLEDPVCGTGHCGYGDLEK
jgi:hypothetical protein